MPFRLYTSESSEQGAPLDKAEEVGVARGSDIDAT